MYFIGDYHASGYILFSNCILLNHLWLGGCSEAFLWLTILDQKVTLFFNIFFAPIYVWYAKGPKKPPDISGFTHCVKGVWTYVCQTPLLDTITYAIWFVEDGVYLVTGLNMDICTSIYVTSMVFRDCILFPSLPGNWANFLATIGQEVLEPWSTIPDIASDIVYEVNKKDYLKFRLQQKFVCNLLVSLHAKSKKDHLDDIISPDLDCYHFAIDTCTSATICKHKELFIGEIKACNHISVQGISGSTGVEGYGSIKIRVMDDDRKTHALIIHNVLYVPDSPINLISPQEWAKGSDDVYGTGEVTVGGTTLLFWNDKKYSKLIPHHAELGIPIMSVNDGYTQSKVLLQSQFCKPCLPTFTHTSEVLEDPKDPSRVHIIPIEDDDEIFRRILPTPIVDPITLPSQHGAVMIEDINDATPFHSSSRFDEQPDDISLMPSESGRSDYTMDEDDQSINLVDELEPEENATVDDDVELPLTEIEAITSALDEHTSVDQREFLALHWKLKHLPFSDMQRLAAEGAIPRKYAKIKPPLCPSCIMGKQHRKPWRGRGKRRRSIRRPDETFPGANTSTDQMISPFGGLIPQMKGKLMRARYYAATIFVDHFTDYTYVHLMPDSTAESTLEAKNAYEQLLRTHGHRVKAYHADNGRFAENVFVGDVRDKAQSMTYCGVGSHHQNGIAERRIKTLGEDARTMLAHGAHLWPEAVSKLLWPFAYKAACRSRNKFKLDAAGLSPEEKLAGIKAPRIIKNEHTLFCPVYVLAGKLQSGIGGIPKWNPRSNAGVYLGQSPEHSSDVALVLNLHTGLVSPQYHVVFDDTFSTVEFLRSKNEPTNWEYLCRNHAEDYRMDALPQTTTIEEIRQELTEWAPPGTTEEQPPAITPEGDNDTQPFDIYDEPVAETGTPPEGVSELPFASVDDDPFPVAVPPVSEDVDTPANAVDHSDGLRRSKRNRKTTSRYLDPADASGAYRRSLTFLSNLFHDVPGPVNTYVAFKSSLVASAQSHQARLQFSDQAMDLNCDGSINSMHPLSYATQSVDNESYHFHEAMKQPDREDFLRAMEKELDDHHNNKHWKLILRSEIKDGIKPIKAIWSFKRKRRPDGSLLKHKARLCAHGGMQVYGVNFWDTYAPVVNWISIRMMLTLAIIRDLYTTSIDFTLAFPQADIETTIYMDIPLGCEVPEGDYVFLLLKNVYGIRQAARTWFEYLRDTLTADPSEGGCGFRQSTVDPCIFYRDGITLITWVDDCLIFAQSKELADTLIAQLQTMFTLTEEGAVDAYLGVQMDIDKDNNNITMSQPFLIQRIIDLLGDAVTAANTKNTPAVWKEVLHRDEHGPPRRQPWNYRSAIGMLNYLAATTRPDILFATHQCARFASNPKLSHERALKRIVRYLKGTADKGIIFSPDTSQGFQCFVDADFAGGFTPETSDDPVSVHSRTGYVIYFMGCPIVWVSKLQTEISLSTVEAEYIALSTAMRDVIPLMDQVKEMDLIYDRTTPKPVIHCTLFEDNNGALELATKPRYRPRTKHIAIKYHHFREHVQNGKVTIEHIDTKDQIADQFTKGLQLAIFQFLRYKLLGW